jgi:uncharacterized protein with FMN-binding domain
LTLAGTLAGLAALVAFKFQPAAGSAAAAGLAAPGASLSTTGGAGAATGTGTSAGTTAPTTAAAKPPASANPKPGDTGGSGTGNGGTGQSTAARVITGAVGNTPYGPMQVAITVASKKITKVTVLQQTNDGGTSQSIDAMAIPQLTQEALAAQSANINAVSGASYTSAGYKQSLQSAIDQAGL